MSRRNLIVIGLGVTILWFVGVVAFQDAIRERTHQLSDRSIGETVTASNGLAEKTIWINGKPLTVELAVTPGEQQRGLGGRDNLPEGRGMLFVYDRPRSLTFWMKGMRFPIDIIWIRDGRVVEIVENLPPPESPLEIPATHTPRADADAVLELPAGDARRFGLRVGDRIPLD